MESPVFLAFYRQGKEILLTKKGSMYEIIKKREAMYEIIV